MPILITKYQLPLASYNAITNTIINTLPMVAVIGDQTNGFHIAIVLVWILVIDIGMVLLFVLDGYGDANGNW